GGAPDPPGRAAIGAGGAHGFACVNELLAVAGAPHVAILCTPPALRLELAEPLLRAGVDLLIEPPLATVPDHADRIAELAERSDRLAMTIRRFRGDLALRDAAARVAAGAVGRLAAVEVALSAKRDARADWRGDPALSGGGVWLELGGDALEIVEALAGPVHRIRMLDSVRLQGGEVEDEARIETEHAGGVVGLVRLSWNEHLARPLARCSGDRGELAPGSAQRRPARGNGGR